MRLQNRRVLGAGVLALGAALVLAGCGAGQITQTASQQPAVNGTHAQVKTIALRNAAVVYPADGQPGYPAGSKPALTLTIVNQGTQDDTLISVGYESGTEMATLGGSKTIVAGHSLVIGPGDAVEAKSEVAQTTSSAPTSTTGTPTGTATSSAEAPTSSATATTAPEGVVGKGSVTLPALANPFWPGQVVKVVFTFQNAGPVTVELPIAAPAHTEE